jgi:hypothetical protein
MSGTNKKHAKELSLGHPDATKPLTVRRLVLESAALDGLAGWIRPE